MAVPLSMEGVGRRAHEQHEAVLVEQEKQHTIFSTDEVADGPLQAKWKPGIKARFPLFGFVALCTMLLAIAFTILILKTAEGKKQEEWPVKYNWARRWSQKGKLKPSSALAGVNTIFNIALAIAIANGVTIAWWRKAMRGATVKELHESWAFSTSAVELFTAGKAFNMIALCALTAKLALLDGIFLQQASGTEPDFLQDYNVSGFRFPIVQELPSDAFGNFSTNGQASYSKSLSAALFNYYVNPSLIGYDQIFKTNDKYKNFDTKCVGRCHITVPGFGLDVQCVQLDAQASEISPITISNNNTNAKTLLDVSFASHFNASNPSIEMYVLYAINTDKGTDPAAGYFSSANTECVGSLARQTCTIRPAVVEYPIFVTNSSSLSISSGTDGVYVDQVAVQDTSTFLSSSYTIDQVQPLKVKSPLSLTANSMVMPAIYQLLTSHFATYIAQSYDIGDGFAIVPGRGTEGSWWAQLQSVNYFPGGCSISIVNPAQWIITEMNNILFRMSLMSATNRDPYSDDYKVPYGSDILENLVGDQTRDTIVYTSNYAWMSGAIVIMVLCVACILPVYWGFWELGRKVTLGPMEIASAFQAPVLSSPGTAAAGGEVNVLLKEVGQRQVRYGEVDGQLAVADAAATRKLVGKKL